MYKGLLLVLTFGDPIWELAVKLGDKNYFQSLVLRVYRKEILPKGAMWPVIWAKPESEIVKFTVWLVKKGSLVDGECGG